LGKGQTLILCIPHLVLIEKHIHIFLQDAARDGFEGQAISTTDNIAHEAVIFCETPSTITYASNNIMN